MILVLEVVKNIESGWHGERRSHCCRCQAQADDEQGQEEEQEEEEVPEKSALVPGTSERCSELQALFGGLYCSTKCARVWVCAVEL